MCGKWTWSQTTMWNAHQTAPSLRSVHSDSHQLHLLAKSHHDIIGLCPPRLREARAQEPDW